MTDQLKQPQATDVILGGQVAPPVIGAVLGGLQGLQQRFLHLDTKQKLEVMPGIVEFGESGIDLLIAALNDAAIAVRSQAYQCLQKVDSEKAKSAIAAGIPLKPGDILYCVYEIPIGYDDETYYRCDSIPEDVSTAGDYTDSVERPSSEAIDWGTLDSEAFDALMEEAEISQLISRHLRREMAEEIAELIHQRLILDRDTPNLFEFNWIHTMAFDVNTWRTNNDLPAQRPEEDWWEMGHQLVKELKAQQQIELLSRLWKETAGSLAVVHEQVINRNCYFKVTRSL